MKIEILPIDQKKFNAYVGLTRNPALTLFAQEIAWYSNQDESVLGVVLFDNYDQDYNPLILGRDEVGRFRAIKVQGSFPSFQEAYQWLDASMRWLSRSDEKVFPQGDPTDKVDVFAEVVPIEKQHPYFIALKKEVALSAAKQMIQEIMPHFVDIDGNFVEQFQSTGFDSRLWELCLYCYFNEEQLTLSRSHEAPDYMISNGELEVAVEAVIVGRKNAPQYYKLATENPFPSLDQEELDEKMPIRFGSPLFTKLSHTNKNKEHYWELAHVVGKPFVIAIHDFHDDHSMSWSHTALLKYLYGYDHEWELVDGKLVIHPTKIESHKSGSKVIPSGFFFQPDAENISAILTSANGTISKFNRLGKQAGFGAKNTIMIRHGLRHDHDPNATKPIPFRYQVTEKSEETWAEGMNVYHNPNAKIKLDPNFFPNAGQHFFSEGQIESHIPDFSPYGSTTLNIVIKE